jgi:hypothetical protein
MVLGFKYTSKAENKTWVNIWINKTKHLGQQATWLIVQYEISLGSNINAVFRPLIQT